jgi:hypothetical protein
VEQVADDMARQAVFDLRAVFDVRYPDDPAGKQQAMQHVKDELKRTFASQVERWLELVRECKKGTEEAAERVRALK